MSIYKAGKIGLATAKIYHRSSKFATMHYQSAVKAIKELSGPVTKSKYGSMIGKHIKKHPIKYTAAGAGVTGYGIGKVNSNKKKGWV